MKTNQQIIRLLTPSWLLIIIGLFTGIFITVATILLSQFQSSELSQQLFFVQSKTPTTSPQLYQHLTDSIAHNHVLSVAPLFLVWAGVGLLVYGFSVAVARAFGVAFLLRDQLTYVNASRQTLLREACIKLGIRALALITWFVWLKLTLSIALPYVLAAGHAASVSVSLDSVVAGLVAIVVSTGVVCVHGILLRAIALRPRLLSR